MPTTHSAPAHDADEDAVLAVLDRVYAAWSIGDADAFVADYREDASALMPGSYLPNRRAIRDAMAYSFGGPLKGTSTSNRVLDLRFATDDTAVVVTESGILGAGETEAPPAQTSNATWVLVRLDGAWQLAAYSNSRRLSVSLASGMRALQQTSSRGPRDLLLVTNVPEPHPGPGEVLVRVTAAGVNFVDSSQARGEFGGGPTPPYLAGIEAAGEVVGMGDGVTGVRPGAHVVGVDVRGGAFAELVVLPANAVLPVPEGWADDQALGLLVNWPTALAALKPLGRLAAGETVLVHAAAGATGQVAVTMAKHFGATVIATASPEKRSVVRGARRRPRPRCTESGPRRRGPPADRGRGGRPGPGVGRGPDVRGQPGRHQTRHGPGGRLGAGRWRGVADELGPRLPASGPGHRSQPRHAHRSRTRRLRRGHGRAVRAGRPGSAQAEQPDPVRAGGRLSSPHRPRVTSDGRETGASPLRAQRRPGSARRSRVSRTSSPR